MLPLTATVFCIEACKAPSEARAEASRVHQTWVAGLEKRDFKALSDYLLDHDVDWGLIEELGATPMSYAIAEGDGELFRFLLEAQANSYESQSKLGYALARTGDLALVDVYLSARSNDQDVLNACLHAAADEGQIPMLRSLLEVGADPKWRTQVNALMLAARAGHLDVVELLLDAGVDVNELTGYQTDQLGETALAMAARNGHLEICRRLLEAGADPNLKHPEGRSALKFARIGDYSSIVSLLIEAGAD